MRNFPRNLLTEWRKLDLPFADKTVVVAVSGGADSVSLLLALDELRRGKKLNLRFVAAHFNHNLRGDQSDADEHFVKTLAEKYNFELATGSGATATEKGNVEQNARDARYRFLLETAETLGASFVLTAHTLNDQAETLLFNLIRGSGLDGLGGMSAKRDLRLEEISRSRLIRPLLNWAKREDTENFCLLNEVEFRYDQMNEDLKFNRVRIRKILLPLLKDFNPKIIETLARTANLLRADAEQLAAGQSSGDEDRRSKIEDRRSKPENLPLKQLKNVFPSMRLSILRDWLKTNRGNLRGLQLKHIEAIERLAFSRKSGRIAELPGGAAVIKEKGSLHFRHKG